MTELEETILFKEKALLRPEVRRSAEKIAGLLSESFFEFGCSGNIYHYHKGDILLEGPANEGDWEITDFSLLQVSLDSVLATYTATKHTEPVAARKVSLRCSLWEKEDGVWKVKFHQGAYANS